MRFFTSMKIVVANGVFSLQPETMRRTAYAVLILLIQPILSHAASASDAAQSAACRAAANSNPKLEQDLAQLPQNNTNLLLRGSIAALEWRINTLRQCDNDAQTLAELQAAQHQQQQALITCRQLAAIDNCLISPLGEQAAAERQRAEEQAQAEREAEEIRELTRQFTNIIVEVIKAEQGNEDEAQGAFRRISTELSPECKIMPPDSLPYSLSVFQG